MFDITLWLQTNERIIKDFGHLYYEPTGRVKKKTVKRSESFILADQKLPDGTIIPGTKFEAYSTQETTRGRVYNKNRPDLFIIDDFESNKTKRSAAITRSISGHLDEMFSGLSPTGQVLFLCNYITESGNVQYILNKAKEDKRFYVHRVDVEIQTPEGVVPAWPSKHVMTDQEAEALNAGIPDKSKQVVSLETKKRTLNAGGRKVYESEMMNSPELSGQLVFDRKKIDEDLAKCTEAIEDRAGFKIWADYNASHRYAIGGDVAKGVGRDSCASVAIDFTSIPAIQMGSYANNQIAPDTFAHELKREGWMLGGCLLAPEVNNQGHATVNELKHIYPIEKIYRQIQTGKTIKVGDKLSAQLGFETGANKTDIIYNLKTAYEAGHLVIRDRRILLEMRAYNQDDLIDTSFDPETTRHFDLLMATAICWQMRNYALLGEAEPEDEYEQPPYQPTSEYESGSQDDQAQML